MPNAFATIDDVQKMWRTMSLAEQEKADYVLGAVSDRLRALGLMQNKNLDEIAAENSVFASVLRSVTCDITVRAMNANAETMDMTQYSQSAMGYVVSGTFANPGGGIFIKKSELQMLGLRRQRVGAMEYDFD